MKKSKWAEKQLSKEQAIAIYDSEVWKDWSADKVVGFQLFQERLCVNFNYFQKCLQKVLGRPVWTHEFAFRDDLVKEYLKERDMPTFQDIVNLIPEEKRIIIGLI